MKGLLIYTNISPVKSQYQSVGGIYPTQTIQQNLHSFYELRKTQMMPPPDHQNPVDMHTSIMCIHILQNIKAVAPKL